MCVCVCVCIFTIYMFKDIYISKYMMEHKYTYMLHTFQYVCVYIYIYIYTCVYVCAYVCVRVFALCVCVRAR